MTRARFFAARRGIGLAAILAVAIPLSACGPEAFGDDIVVQGYEMVGGSFEPNYSYPWVVKTKGSRSCHGVLIDPSWVLTAAHCVYGLRGRKVRWARTDPYSGITSSQQRTASVIYEHPDYSLYNISHDIGLVKLSSPFAINEYIQTVGLPATPDIVGTSGTLASDSHLPSPPLGTDEIAVYRATLPPLLSGGLKFEVPSTSSAGVELHTGDSGSGLVTVEGGRALVRGIASYVTASGTAGFTDVYAYRSWISSTMGKTAAALAGNTRVRWSGHTSRGLMGLGCTNPAGTMWGPLNVVGVRLGAGCASGNTQAIVCSLNSGQPYVIRSFTMKTTYANGSTSTTSLSHTNRWASYYGLMPAGVVREFTCSVGWNYPTKFMFTHTMFAR